MKKKKQQKSTFKERLVKFTNLFYKEVYCTKDGIKTVLRYHMPKFNIPRLPSCSLHSYIVQVLPNSLLRPLSLLSRQKQTKDPTWLKHSLLHKSYPCQIFISV